MANCCTRLSKKPIFWLKLYESLFGVVVCAFFTTFYGIPAYAYDLRTNLSSYAYEVQSNIACVVANGFLYVNFILFIGMCAERNFETNIVHPIFSGIGMVLSVIAGGIVTYNTINVGYPYYPYYPYSGTANVNAMNHNATLGAQKLGISYYYYDSFDYSGCLGTGICFILYAFTYLADFIIYFTVSRRRAAARSIKNNLEYRHLKENRY